MKVEEKGVQIELLLLMYISVNIELILCKQFVIRIV